jgi:hypothetical protein
MFLQTLPASSGLFHPACFIRTIALQILEFLLSCEKSMMLSPKGGQSSLAAIDNQPTERD